MAYFVMMTVVDGFSNITYDSTGSQLVESSIVVPDLAAMAVFHHQI